MGLREPRRPTFLSPKAWRIVRSYGLLVLVAIGFLILALTVTSVDEPVSPDTGFGATQTEART